MTEKLGTTVLLLIMAGCNVHLIRRVRHELALQKGKKS